MVEGFKNTEAGSIPIDWEVKKLGEVSDIKTGPFGSALHQKDYVNDGTPIITVEHLSEYGIVSKNMPMISDADKKRLDSYILQTNDIVFSRVGSVDRNSIVKELESGWLFSGRLLRIRITSKNISPKYLSFHFQQKTFKQRVITVAVGQTMASLNTQILKNIDVVLPPTKAEQTAIAAALNDADTLTNQLEQLLTKKRNIKTGAMQELLKPKQGWESRPLHEVSYMKGRIGWQGLKQSEFTMHPDHPFLITGMNFKDGEIRWNEVYHVRQDRYEMAKEIQLKKDDVLFTKDGTIGKLLYVSDIPYPNKATLNSHLLVLRPLNGRFISKFLYYQLDSRSFKDFIELRKTGTTFFGMSQEAVGEYQMFLPEITKQRIIADTLTSMDEEIERLETQLSKYKMLKQGMMQSLLTGKIRLV